MAKVESIIKVEKDAIKKDVRKIKITNKILKTPKTIKRKLFTEEDEEINGLKCFVCKEMTSPPRKIYRSYEGFPVCSVCTGGKIKKGGTQ